MPDTALRRQRYWADPEKYRAQCRKWRAAHLDEERTVRRQRYAENPEPHRVRSRRYTANRAQHVREKRKEALRLLGGRCKKCGEHNFDVLHIDHIRGDRDGGEKATREVLRMSCPGKKFQILCANCHVRKTKTLREYLTAEKRGAQLSITWVNDRTKWTRLRRKSFALLSDDPKCPSCQHCGERDETVLQIDHIRRRPGTTKHAHREVLRSQAPRKDFQLLCANCHVKKTKKRNEHIRSAQKIKKLKS